MRFRAHFLTAFFGVTAALTHSCAPSETGSQSLSAEDEPQVDCFTPPGTTGHQCALMLPPEPVPLDRIGPGPSRTTLFEHKTNLAGNHCALRVFETGNYPRTLTVTCQAKHVERSSRSYWCDSGARNKPNSTVFEAVEPLPLFDPPSVEWEEISSLDLERVDDAALAEFVDENQGSLLRFAQSCRQWIPSGLVERDQNVENTTLEQILESEGIVCTLSYPQSNKPGDGNAAAFCAQADPEHDDSEAEYDDSFCYVSAEVTQEKTEFCRSPRRYSEPDEDHSGKDQRVECFNSTANGEESIPQNVGVQAATFITESESRLLTYIQRWALSRSGCAEDLAVSEENRLTHAEFLNGPTRNGILQD